MAIEIGPLSVAEIDKIGQRHDRISQLMKDAHYECCTAASFLTGIMRAGQRANEVAASMCIAKAMSIIREIEALKEGAPL